jgi:exodeoxyribonuclease V gamma subunit
MTQQSLNNSMEKRLLASTDRSVSVHVCHSAQREVEVLHDNLLEMMAADATLAPRDIIVMVADIDSYAPYIQAVFGNAPADRFMPFSISDRKASLSHPALDAFINLLSLPQSRFHAEDVLALLEVPALAARFNIDEEGLKLLRQWVAGAGVRWGLDDDTVRQLDLPPTGQHTWKFGLTRMLLGYAMDSRAGEWQAILPYDESCGLAAELAGNLAQFLMQLSQWRQCLAQPRTLEAWLPLCQEMLSAFFVAEGDAEVALALIEQQWQKVVGQGLAARYPDDVPIGVLHDELASRLDQERISQRFLAGSVNFCTLMPMRSIPFRVVCLLGMNDGVYPRTLAPLGFDLMAKNIQRGDRSRRDDDRYLFLEALLSAEECLYLSYVGYAIQDNSQRLPSVLVSELLDYIGQNFCLQQHLHSPADESARAVKGHVSVLHTRTPFDVANFIPDSEQQSYATEWLPAATMSGQAALDFSQPLAAAQISEVTLEQLVRFYRHPVKGFFQMRLGVSFVLEQTDLPDEEPFVLDNLSRYQFNYQLLNCLVAGEDSQALYQRLKASGGLPYGVFGELYWQKQQAEIQMLAQQVRETRQESDSLEIDLLCDGLRLTGWLHHVQADGLLRWRPAQLQARDGMLLWLEHLVYCACGGGGSSRMLGTNDSQWHFAAIDSSCALQQLTQLIKGYRQGLRAPLLLLYKSGWAWLNECYDHTTNRLSDDVTCQEKARNKLLQAWQGNAFSPGESSDPYLQRVMRSLSDDQLDEICRQAMSFLVPLLKNNHE